MWLSVIGLLLSILIHLSALLGAPNPLGKLVWGLHIGIFMVFVPAVVAAQRMSRGVEQSEAWKVILRGCPTWMKVMMWGFFGYTFVNFLFVFVIQSGGEGSSLRAFSGHWMLFYFAAFAMLYSATRPGVLRCPAGHEVSPLSKHCKVCGSPINIDKR
jgi:hypothetical protein